MCTPQYKALRGAQKAFADALGVLGNTQIALAPKSDSMHHNMLFSIVNTLYWVITKIHSTLTMPCSPGSIPDGHLKMSYLTIGHPQAQPLPNMLRLPRPRARLRWTPTRATMNMMSANASAMRCVVNGVKLDDDDAWCGTQGTRTHVRCGRKSTPTNRLGRYAAIKRYL